MLDIHDSLAMDGFPAGLEAGQRLFMVKWSVRPAVFIRGITTAIRNECGCPNPDDEGEHGSWCPPWCDKRGGDSDGVGEKAAGDRTADN